MEYGNIIVQQSPTAQSPTDNEQKSIIFNVLKQWENNDNNDETNIV